MLSRSHVGWLTFTCLAAACGGQAVTGAQSSSGDAGTDAFVSAGGEGGSGGEGGGGGTAGGLGGVGGTSGVGGMGGDCGTCLPLEECWNSQLCVARRVKVAGGFVIDATEVTRRQYAAWLSTNPSAAGQSERCSWNSSFEHDPACLAKDSVCQGDACGGHPQVCIDECDAVAYCAAIGKRLCGAIGGGSVLLENDASQSQWFNACTSGGVNDFVYGTSPQKGTCNDYLTFTTTTVSGGSLQDCESSVAGYDGVYDLIGNVWEWEDNCIIVDAGPDLCKPRGFSFGMGAAMPMCDGSDYARRDEARDNLGFRCCMP